MYDFLGERLNFLFTLRLRYLYRPLRSGSKNQRADYSISVIEKYGESGFRTSLDRGERFPYLTTLFSQELWARITTHVLNSGWETSSSKRPKPSMGELLQTVGDPWRNFGRLMVLILCLLYTSLFEFSKTHHVFQKLRF